MHPIIEDGINKVLLELAVQAEHKAENDKYYEKVKIEFNRLIEQQEANKTDGFDPPGRCYTFLCARCKVKKDYNLDYNPTMSFSYVSDTKDIYFARAENGLTKIGMSSDVDKRIKSLERLVYPFELKLIHIIPGGGHDLERALHHEFRHLRACGEWFFLDIDDTTVVEL